jgi:hypothetical protein
MDCERRGTFWRAAKVTTAVIGTFSRCSPIITGNFMRITSTPNLRSNGHSATDQSGSDALSTRLFEMDVGGSLPVTARARIITHNGLGTSRQADGLNSGCRRHLQCTRQRVGSVLSRRSGQCPSRPVRRASPGEGAGRGLAGRTAQPRSDAVRSVNLQYPPNNYSYQHGYREMMPGKDE